MELTEEQWERIIQYYRLTRGEQVARALTTAKQFCEGMAKIQSSAGHSQEELNTVSQALLNMTNEEGVAI